MNFYFRFFSVESISAHIDLIHPDGGEECNECHNKFRDTDSLELHKLNVHRYVSRKNSDLTHAATDQSTNYRKGSYSEFHKKQNLSRCLIF